MNQRSDRMIAVLISTLLVGTFVYLQLGDPYQKVLISQVVSLTPLNHAQRSNLRIASEKLNNLVIEKQALFSFNAIVGPRTLTRGYRPAHTYLGSESPDSIGGGICVLSSALYQMALKTNLQIRDRHAHTRSTQTIPTGLDATVWYGQADLIFQNNTGQKLQLKVIPSTNFLTIELRGASRLPLYQIRRRARIINDGIEEVEVFLEPESVVAEGGTKSVTPPPSDSSDSSGLKSRFISRDFYR